MIFMSILVGGLVGFAAERFRITRNGYILSIALAVGGSVLFWFAQRYFGIGFGLSRGLTSGLGAVAMLFLASLRK